MLETKFTEFPALSIDSKVGISRSTSQSDVWLLFFSYGIKNCYLLSTISFIFDIQRCIMTFYEFHLVFFVMV